MREKEKLFLAEIAEVKNQSQKYKDESREKDKLLRLQHTEFEDRLIRAKIEWDRQKDDHLRMRVKEVYQEVEKEYSEILEDKEKSILLLKQRVTKLAKELES